MGNAAGKHHPGGKKYVHWDAAVPPAPPGKPQLVPGTPNSQPDLVTISWEPPINDGGAPVTGFLVEHRRTGSPHWVRSMPSLVPVPELTLSGLEPGWRYQFRVSAKNAAGMSEPGDVSEPLTVTLNRSAASAPHFVQELHDTIALENETAEFKVHFRGTPTPKLAWYKDGFEIFSSRRMKVVTEGDLSTLVIYQTAFSDEGEIKCTATNRVGHVVTRAKLRLEAPPSIRIPRQYEDGLLFEMGEIIRLKVSVAGRPLPRVTWFHNGEQVMFGGRYEVTNTDRSSSIRVAEARRADRGEYQIRATNRLGEDVASFLVTVTDRPMPPGKAQVVTTLGRSVTLSWSMPDDDGGCKIGNYIVEYYRIGWNVWLKAATCRQLSTTLGDLIEGSEYKFRVKAENPYGVSDPSEESDVVFLPDPKRGLLEPPARKRGSKTDIKVEDRKSQKPGSGRTTPQPAEEKPVAKKEIPLAGKRKEIEDIAEPPKKGAPDLRLVRSKEWETVDRPVPVIMYEDKKSHESVKQKNKENVAKNVEGTISKQSKPDLKRKEDEPPPIPPKTVRKASPLQKQAQIPAQAQVQTPTKVPTQTMAVPKTKPISPNASVKKQSQEENARRGSLVDEKAKKSHLLSPNTPLTPREDDDSIMHGSSELMLVLLPEGESGEANRERRAQSERRFEFGNTYQESESLVAPPMSLSAPELGSGEPAITNPLRNAVSSTELLHEKAMARFYQAVAAEEAEKARKRRQSIERPTSTTPASTRLSSLEYEDEEVKRVSKNREIGRERLSSIEDGVELRKTLKEKSLQNQQIDKSPLLRRLEDNRTDIKLLTPQEGKGPSKLLTQEEEQEEFSRIRERLNKGEVGQRKGQIRQTSQEEMEEDDDEDLDEEDSLDESIDYDDDEDEPYHPRSFIPQTELRAKIEPTFLSFDRDVYSEDDEEDTYHPMSMIPRQVISLAVPSETEVKPEVEPAFVPIQATEAISSEEPLPDLDRKNNIEVPSDFAVLRSSTSPSPSVESDIVVRRRKKEPPPTQTTEAIGSGKEEAQLHDDDVGLTAGEIARKRRLQARQSSLEEEANLQRVVSSHYDDFIREFGRTKKRQVQLYTNTEDLKAAAFSSGEDVNIEDAIVETPQAEKPPVKESTILQEYEDRWQKLQQKQEELAVKWKKEEISEEVQIKQPKKRGASGRERKIDKPEQKEEEILPTPQEEKTEIPRRKWWWWWWWRKERSVEDKTDIQDSPPLPPPPPPPRPPISPSSPPPPPVTKMEVPTLTGEVVKPKPDMDISEGTLTPDEIKLQVAEKNVRSFIEYMSDIAMFSVACCLYIFENEILAIPLLVLMVYRQTCQAIKRKIPAKWRRSR